MRLQVIVALACLISLTGIQQILCDKVSDASNINKWTCTCSSAYQGNHSFAIETNCSTSCDCSPAGSSEDRWTCMCSADGLPEVGSWQSQQKLFYILQLHFWIFAFKLPKKPTNQDRMESQSRYDPNDPATILIWGSIGHVDSSKKWISSKAVVIVLLICVLLTTLAFTASVACYVYRRDKCPVQGPLFSSDKDTSFSSATNLISHGASSVPESRVYIGSINPFTGCIHKASLLFRSKRETIHGTIVRFSYPELEDATDKFSNSNLIGGGGSSHVYSGLLRDGRTVAVKRLKIQGGADSEAIFLTEIELISRLHHCHVVPLLGYCSENQGKHAERLLVFEYMLNGNLRECLDGASGKCLDWGTRIAIALGAAKGLEYLHEAAAPKILHRDVKSTNVLLDENWRAKITDLGMAKHLRTDDLPSYPSSPARMQGTFGYFAPEYAIVGRASLKSDVFSFGATPRLLESRRVIMELPDPQLKGNFPEEEMQIMAYLAKECLLLDPDSRPSMSEVVQILSTIAPENSRRQNFTINLFQSSTHCIKGDVDIERADKQC
ncbi:hypothetical protein HYC85_031860 [Camellia sinensis]|uniref:non-specific serine/threonine protein kinase n=1 Tax=Camellia sinensis TaxID=4442 RepID=A0A7J7FSA4_CAMSI|nr:hypothetical protein HYC85_031860 [Camellia sinensis]